MLLKKHYSGNKLLVALCDSELINKQYEEENKILDLKSNFYQGKKTSLDETQKILSEAYLINAVGEKSVNLIIKMGFVSLESVKKIQNIPYTFVLIES